MRDYKRDSLYPYKKILSSTQVLDYARSPKDFYATWVAGFDSKKQSPALHLGICFDALYADRSFDYLGYLREHKVPPRLVLALEQGIKFMPQAFNPQTELLCKVGNWSFRATLDDYDPSGIIMEHKTSALLWTQETVDNHDQLSFQEWVYWKSKNKLPKKHYVVWVDTSSNPQRRVTTLETKRSKEQLAEFEKKIILPVIAGIEAGNFSQSIF